MTTLKTIVAFRSAKGFLSCFNGATSVMTGKTFCCFAVQGSPGLPEEEIRKTRARALEPGPDEIGVMESAFHLTTGAGLIWEHVEGHATVDKVNIQEKLALFHDHWSPRIVGELNGQHVKLVKFQGEFVWHKHAHEDELFLVVNGRFRMEYRDRHVWLEEGEFLIVPRGVEHRPVADEEVHVLLFEPAGTLNTGDVRDGRTIQELKRI